MRHMDVFRRRAGVVLALVAGASLVALTPARAVAMTTQDAHDRYGYPYPNAPDCDEVTGANCAPDQWGFVQGQCHSWAAYRLDQLNAAELRGARFDNWYRQPSGQQWGSVWHWGIAAQAAGVTIDDTPALGSLAWWKDNGGHVAYVEAVNPDGTVQISEMNADYHNGFDFATLQRGGRWPTGGFLHVADRQTVTGSTPGAPTNVGAGAGNRQATVSWSIPAANGAPITSFHVTASPGGASTTVGPANTSATVTGLTNGTSYTFTVHATNANGDSPESAPSNPVVPATIPDAPTNVGASASNSQARVTWSVPAANGAPITGFHVTASPGGASTTVGPANTSATVTGLTNGTGYTFTVHATNANGDSPESAPSNPVVPATIPDAPTRVRVTAKGHVASVSWSAPAANGSPVSSYVVLEYRGTGLAMSLTTGPATHVTVSGLRDGSTYSFGVIARNAVGLGPRSARSASITLVRVDAAPPAGYWMLAADGSIFPFARVADLGHPSRPSVAFAPTGDGRGYWVTDRSGVVSHFGTAGAFGGRPSLRAGEAVSTISATPSGKGYWLFTNLGRVFGYGDARPYGDLGSIRLNGWIVASVATPTGHGYFMLGSDGGVFTFGDARFRGSMGAHHLNAPIVGIVPTRDNSGYWLVASDGGIFAFGNARFHGSMGSVRLAQPVVGMTRYGNGYLMVSADGGVFDFSNKPFAGSLADRRVPSPVVAIAATG